MVGTLANYGGEGCSTLWGHLDVFQTSSGTHFQFLKRDQGLSETENEPAPFESENVHWFGRALLSARGAGSLQQMKDMEGR